MLADPEPFSRHSPRKRGERTDSLKNTVFLDDRLESYRGLFSGDWPTRAMATAGDAASLQELLFDLVGQWRGAAYTAEFPAVLAGHLSTFATEFVRDRAPNTGILKLADAMAQRFSRNVPAVTADSTIQRRLHEESVKLAAEITEGKETLDYKLSQQDIWEKYFEEHVFQITLWSSLRISYVAIYNAYENFIVQCARIATGDQSIVVGRDLNKSFSEAFGESMLQKCWASNDMYIIRQVRHSLSHAGGRNTKKLKRLKHSVRIDDGKLQIVPDDLRHEYAVLQEGTLALIELVSESPQFR